MPYLTKLFLRKARSTENYRKILSSSVIDQGCKSLRRRKIYNDICFFLNIRDSFIYGELSGTVHYINTCNYFHICFIFYYLAYSISHTSVAATKYNSDHN